MFQPLSTGVVKTPSSFEPNALNLLGVICHSVLNFFRANKQRLLAGCCQDGQHLVPRWCALQQSCLASAAGCLFSASSQSLLTIAHTVLWLSACHCLYSNAHTRTHARTHRRTPTGSGLSCGCCLALAPHRLPDSCLPAPTPPRRSSVFRSYTRAIDACTWQLSTRPRSHVMCKVIGMP